MNDTTLLLAFLALMAINVFASLMYFTSFRDLRAAFRRKLR